MGYHTVIRKLNSILSIELAEEQPSPRKPSGPISESSSAMRWGALFVGVVFLAIGMQYMDSDLWFDEILTLNDYAVQDQFGAIFRSYRVANNHILYSFLLWLWIHLFGQGTEAFLRLPSVLMSLATLYIAFVYSHRLFKNFAAGFFVVLILAFNPVFVGFFSQLRGYSLTIMLAMVATIGALYLAIGKIHRGILMYCIGAFLLPTVLPTNLITNFALLLFVNIYWFRQGRWLRRVVYLILPGIATVAGMLVYFPIRYSFMEVMRSTMGWSSGWAVIANWSLALVACFGCFMLACYGLQRRKDIPASEKMPDHVELVYRSLPYLAGSAFSCLIIVAFFRAPFPRSLLGLLPAFVFSAMLGFRPNLVRINKYFALLMFFVLANFLVVSRISKHLCNESLSGGVYRQNLLQQYYSHNRDVSITIHFLLQQGILPPNVHVLADFHIFPSARHYWSMLGGNPQKVECYNNNSERFRLRRHPEHYAYLPCIVLTYDGDQAIRSFRENYGMEIKLSPLISLTNLQVFRLVVTRAEPRVPWSPGLPLLPEADDAI